MSWAIWITGVPGSGKSTLARGAAARLCGLGISVRVLELDEIRKTLTPSPTYSEAEREVVYRALVYFAAMLTEASVPVIIDATAHRRAWRDLARKEILQFAEVQLICPVDVARDRERARRPGHAPRAIYARAGRPGATVPGVDVPYEAALAPELVIDTTEEGTTTSVGRILELARRLSGAPGFEIRTTSPAWAIWITGRPGSGKTTLAGRVAEAVAVRGMRVKRLDVGSLRRFLGPRDAKSESDQEIVHGALAYAAKLLTDAGVSVIVDATAPRRAWREAARALIPCFAEVQLLCPPDVCAERERAMRWRGAASATLDRSPDISIEYEHSLRPELTVRTDVHDPWSAVDQIIFLIDRMRRTTPYGLEQPSRRPPCEFEN